jgi:hypothetical protein
MRAGFARIAIVFSQSILLVGWVATARLEGAGFVHSSNFTVFTPAEPSREAANAFAAAVLERAEQLRKQIAIEWLGDELPPSIGQVLLNVDYSNKPDSGLTWAKDRPDRKLHALFISTTPGQLPDGVLAHEMVHCVLATRYPHPNRLPAWLEEGIASRYDDANRQQIRQRIMSWFVTTGNWPRLEAVLSSKRVHSDDQEAYALAATVTELLLERGNRQKLLGFGELVGKEGLDRALNQCYGIGGAAELELLWKARYSRNITAVMAGPR